MRSQWSDYEEEDSPWKFRLFSEVTWHDRDNEGISTGVYEIIERLELGEEPGQNKYLLSNGVFNVEAYERDLSE